MGSKRILRPSQFVSFSLTNCASNEIDEYFSPEKLLFNRRNAYIHKKDRPSSQETPEFHLNSSIEDDFTSIRYPSQDTTNHCTEYNQQKMVHRLAPILFDEELPLTTPRTSIEPAPWFHNFGSSRDLGAILRQARENATNKSLITEINESSSQHQNDHSSDGHKNGLRKRSLFGGYHHKHTEEKHHAKRSLRKDKAKKGGGFRSKNKKVALIDQESFLYGGRRMYSDGKISLESEDSSNVSSKGGGRSSWFGCWRPQMK